MRLVLSAMLVVCGFLLISAEPRSQLRRGRQLNILDTITDEQMENTEINPWVPCQTLSADGETLLKRDFCRLECVASWSYSPQRMQCEKLDPGPLIARSFSVGGAAFRELSENSFSKVPPTPARCTSPAMRCSKMRLPLSPGRSTRVRRLLTTPMWARSQAWLAASRGVIVSPLL